MEVVISEIQNLWGPSFSSKFWEFNLDFKNVFRVVISKLQNLWGNLSGQNVQNFM